MAIWDRLLKKAISPIINKEINKFKKEEVRKGLATSKLSWDYIPVGAGTIKGSKGVAERPFPKGVGFSTLRDFSIIYPILRACISYRKRQITQLDWDIAPLEVIADKKKKKKYQEDAKRVKEFLTNPTGDKTVSFRTFVKKILEDLLVLDAVSVYRRKNRGGSLYGYLPIDATTI